MDLFRRKNLLKLLKMSTVTNKSQINTKCFTKYDQNRLKIIDIGANLSGICFFVVVKDNYYKKNKANF